ncbi:MEDS domain-containing protein [Actinoallomurus oryzae]|uniref:MEDS domain-containing protein n=1 Tax=Actinoallomurus oryzae TaxID=502180 RepID=UPI003CD07889
MPPRHALRPSDASPPPGLLAPAARHGDSSEGSLPRLPRRSGVLWLSPGRFDSDRMFAVIGREVTEAAEQGYPAVRLTADMSWALRRPGAYPLMPACEARFTQAIAAETAVMAISPCARRALCSQRGLALPDLRCGPGVGRVALLLRQGIDPGGLLVWWWSASRSAASGEESLALLRGFACVVPQSEIVRATLGTAVGSLVPPNTAGQAGTTTVPRLRSWRRVGPRSADGSGWPPGRRVVASSSSLARQPRGQGSGTRAITAAPSWSASCRFRRRRVARRPTGMSVLPSGNVSAGHGFGSCWEEP